MTIPQIKAALSMRQLLAHCGITPKPDGHLRCPLHDDSNPSAQVFDDSNTLRCYSTNCSHAGKTIDVIDLVMFKDGCSKAQAIQKCKQLAGQTPSTSVKPAPKPSNSALATQAARQAILLNAWAYMRHGIQSARAPRAYLAARALDREALLRRGIEVAYNSGQMHHGARSTPQLIDSLLSVGLLTEVVGGRKSRTGATSYRSTGKGSIAFALRDANDEVAGFYFRAIAPDTTKANRHRYLRDRRGLFPHYPAASTQRLLLTESVIDAASVVQVITPEPDNQAAKADDTWYVLALYGTAGLTDEHRTAIAALDQLLEVCLLLDGDQAGRTATQLVAQQLRELKPNLLISSVPTPADQDANALLVAHGDTLIKHLIEERTTIQQPEPQPEAPADPPTPQPPALPPSPDRRRLNTNEEAPALDTSRPHDLRFSGKAAELRIKGLKTDQFDTLRITLQLLTTTTDAPARLTLKLDLYDYRDVQRTIRTATDTLACEADALAQDLDQLTELLERHLDQQRSNTNASAAHDPEQRTPALTPERSKAAAALLADPNLIARVTTLLGTAGIVGEHRNRSLLLLATSSYKATKPLHVLIQGSSGSGKTRLLDVVANCLPAEDVRRYTRVTDNALYNQPPDFFRHTILLLEDLDGLSEDAQYALRELQSLGVIRVVKSVKDERTGQITGAAHLTRGPVASAACTTRGSVYEDNLSRCLVVAVDESPEQTARVINYQNQVAAGLISSTERDAARQLIADAIRLLKPQEVVNPYAAQISLPKGVHKARRLHELYLAFCAQVTWWHQRQRRTDHLGRLIAQPGDLRIAADILFDAIVLKADELDGSLRHFYERLKAYLNTTGRDTFTQRALRQAINVSQPLCSRRCARLMQAEYLTVEYPANNRRKCYRLANPDDYGALRARIHRHLTDQIDEVKPRRVPAANALA